MDHAVIQDQTYTESLAQTFRNPKKYLHTSYINIRIIANIKGYSKYNSQKRNQSKRNRYFPEQKREIPMSMVTKPCVRYSNKKRICLNSEQ